MIFWEILQSLGQTWEPAAVQAWMVGVKVGAGALTGTMGDRLLAAGWGGSLPGLGRLAYCDGNSADRRLVQVVGAGSTGDRSYEIWRIATAAEVDQAPSREERERLAGRLSFLRGAIRKWEDATARHPGVAARGGIGEWRAELDALVRRLQPIGSLFVVAYVGYGRHWHAQSYLLRGPGGAWVEPVKPKVVVHCWETTNWTWCGRQRRGAMVGVEGWRGYLLCTNVRKEERCMECLRAILAETGPI